MDIKVKERKDSTVSLGQIPEGAWFVRWENPRSLDNARVYLKLHCHTRLERFCRSPDMIPVVDLKYGRIDSLKPMQRVLELKGTLELEVQL